MVSPLVFTIEVVGDSGECQDADGFEWLEIPFIAIHFYILVHILTWELKSVDENFKRLGYNLKIFALITDIFVTVRVMLKKKINK